MELSTEEPTTNNKKSRGSRISKVQKLYLAQYMHDNKDVARRRFSASFHPRDYEEKFEELVEELNKLGPAKNVDKWKRVWIDQQLIAKKKARALHKRTITTGGRSGFSLDSLSPTTLKIVSISGGQKSFASLSRFKEFGFSKSQPIPIITNPTPSSSEGQHELDEESNSIEQLSSNVEEEVIMVDGIMPLDVSPEFCYEPTSHRKSSSTSDISGSTRSDETTPLAGIAPKKTPVSYNENQPKKKKRLDVGKSANDFYSLSTLNIAKENNEILRKIETMLAQFTSNFREIGEKIIDSIERGIQVQQQVASSLNKLTDH